MKDLLAASGKDTKLISCTFCSKLCSKVNIKRHMLTHMDIPYKCGRCSAYFHLKKHFDRHMLEKHNSKDYVCDLCGTKYRSPNALKEHIQIKHSNLRLAYSCEVCGKDFNRLRHYEDHMNVHKKVNPWVCNNCDRTYKNRSALSRHISECGKQTENRCMECGQLYKTKHSLHEHVKREHSNVRYPCKCGIIFRSRSARMRHRKVCQDYIKELTTMEAKTQVKNSEILDPAAGFITKESQEVNTQKLAPSSSQIPLSTVVTGDVTVYLETTSNSEACELDQSSFTELVVVSEDSVGGVNKQIMPGEILQVAMIGETEINNQ